MGRIKYKGIVHEVMNDAPFIGALIVANSCKNKCKNCINEHLKSKKYIENTAEEIVKFVTENPLNRGIILAGLEWTEQSYDLVEIAKVAIEIGLDVIIYTHHTEESFFNISHIEELKNMPLYIKFGEYDETLACENNVSFGVRLATSNQYIKKFGD